VSKKSAIGDVFEVRLDSSTRRFFHYIANDKSQLHSHVVRVLKKSYELEEVVDLADVVRGEIDFHAHVLLGIGLKQKFWRKVGHVKCDGNADVLFRDTDDVGDPSIKVSINWYVWKIGGPFRDVGSLRPEYVDAEIGVVVPPDSLIHRIRYGTYDFVYPNY
jgi:hypothetical protein